MKDKTATECWIILKNEIEGINERFVPIKKTKGNDLERNICQKKLYERLLISKLCGDYTETMDI